MIGAEDEHVEELNKALAKYVHGHGRVKVKVLASALGALEVHGKVERVRVLQPDPKFTALALVILVAVVELLVTAAQQLIELGGHPLPGRECLEVILQLDGNVLRHLL